MLPPDDNNTGGRPIGRGIEQGRHGRCAHLLETAGRYPSCPCSKFDLILEIRLPAMLATNVSQRQVNLPWLQCALHGAGRPRSRASEVVDMSSRSHPNAACSVRSLDVTRRVVRSDGANHRPPGKQ